jgi:hypothetical protein
MTATSIPSTKASPDLLVDLMKIIDRHTGNIELMKKEIHRYLLEKSTRGKRDEYNSVYAITFPTLRRLELIDGKGSEVHLSSDGKILLDIFGKNGILHYKKNLAKLLLRIDAEKAHVLENLLVLNKSEISIGELVAVLKKAGVDTNDNDDRLLKWLRFLKHVDFVDYEDVNSITVNIFQIKSIMEGKKPVDFDTFLVALFEEYQKSVSKNRGNVYVKIPELQRKVCTRLENLHFTTFDFRDYLTKLKTTNIRGKKVIFSKPGAREMGGIKIDKTYYYYISAYETE